MSGLSIIKKTLPDKPGVMRPFVVVVLIFTWYMTFFACVLSDGKYFYVSNLLMYFVFLKSEALWSAIMLLLLCVLIAAPFSEKLFHAVHIGFCVELVFLVFTSLSGFGIFWNANGSKTLNDIYIAEMFTSFATARPFSYLYGFLVSEDKYAIGRYAYNLFSIVPAISYIIGIIPISWREHLKKKGDHK